MKKRAKIYISTAPTFEDAEQVKARFEKTAEFWQGLGLEVANLSHYEEEAELPWIKRLCKGLERLFVCDILYLQEDWGNSIGAGVEYDFALRMGKKILFERGLSPHIELFRGIELAILEAFGLRLCEYRAKERRREHHFARLVFSHHAFLQGARLGEIAGILGRSPSSVAYFLEKYYEERGYNKEFREKAEQVENLLKQNDTQ